MAFPRSKPPQPDQDRQQYQRRADLWPLNPNGDLLCVFLIETPEGVKNINEIASVPGVGIIHAANEVGLKTNLFGGGMVGLQTTSVKQELGPLMNGIVNYDFWIPAPTMKFPGVDEFLKKYQDKAKGSGVDPLGYYLAPWAYSYMQVLADAVTGAGGLDQQKIADYLRSHTFKTVMGDIAFGPDGELSEPHDLMVQYQHLTGNGLDQFNTGKQPVILWPPKYADGKALYPYTDSRK